MGDREEVAEKANAYLYQHPKHPPELGFIPLTEGDRRAGWTETPLYVLAHPNA